MKRYILIKDNLVSSIIKCDNTSSILSEDHVIIDSQNHPGVGINHIYDSDTNTFKLYQKQTTFINHSSSSFDDEDPNYIVADGVMGTYTSASYDTDGNLETPESITSSSVSLEFLYPINSVSSDPLRLIGAKASNFTTENNTITFDLFPNSSLHPQGEIEIIFNKNKITSTNGEIFPENAPRSTTIIYQSI